MIDYLPISTDEFRKDTFNMVTALAITRRPKVIIETGCFRGNREEGLSTLHLSKLAEFIGGQFYSVDIEPEYIELAGELVSGSHINFACMDSVEFLSKFAGQIGLLYLDSCDIDLENPGPSQRHQLAELGAAWGKLSRDCLVLLDDCGMRHGGKGALSTPFLLERGFIELSKEGQYQRLFQRI